LVELQEPFIWHMPQEFGSSGAQVGTGRALMRGPTADWEVFAMWVEATAPVTTRDRAKARRRVFM
jgi:hypothetical protein